MIDAASLIGKADIVFITLDTLRYDVAVAELEAGRTPNLARVLPGGVWEKRHTPGSFTYAAHCAFFAGFLPTPATPGKHPRLFALRFPGSETTDERTAVFDAPDIVTGLRQAGYRAICIGGVGFFNLQTPLGRVLPSLFDEAHWDETLGVTNPHSTENQLRLAAERLSETKERAFLFVNVSAIHQPNYFYVPGRTREHGDDLESHAAALRYVDSQLPILLSALRPPTLLIICSDHGTTCGEDGFYGHRLAHRSVWDVPYSESIISSSAAS